MPRSGVGCFVLRPHPERPVLLLRRATSQHRGSWCPVAGEVDPGESPEAAARRELAEETGLRARSLERLYPEPVSAADARGGVALVVFVASVGGGERVALNGEHDASRWFSFEEAASLLPLDAQRAALRKLSDSLRQLSAADEIDRAR